MAFFFLFCAAGMVSPLICAGQPVFGPVREEPAPPPSPESDETAARTDGTGSASLTLTEGGQVELNFDDADLYEVIRAFADILDINYIIEPDVSGRVTIHTAGQLRKENLFPIFFQILDVNGLTAVKEGNLYRILPLKNAPRLSIATGSGYPSKEQGERPVIQIIPLAHVSAQEMVKVLAPFVSAQGTLVAHDAANTLLAVDTRENIRKVMKIIRAFDVNLLTRANHRFFSLKYADPEETAQAVADILAAYGAGVRDEVKIIPLPRLDTLLAVSTNPQTFSVIEAFLEKLDVPGQEVNPGIHVYFVKNGKAGDLAEILEQVFSETPLSRSDRSAEKSGGTGRSNQAAQTTAETPGADVQMFGGPSLTQGEVSTAGALAGTRNSSRSSEESRTAGKTLTLRSGIRITPDPVRNALIIEATPADYRIVGTILEKLDVLPRQVLIEVTIAEITLSASRDLGVEWEYGKGEGAPDLSLLDANMGSAGLQYIVGLTNRWKTTLSALAKEDKVNILSAPTILASDNREANIDISTEIPVASAQYQYQSENEPLLQTNIQYRNTGVILTVTPHINEFGLVSMDISQEVSEKSENVDVGRDSLPSFFKRSVNTYLTVHHGQTIVIGGLIRENVSTGRSGVPCLGGIPVVEFLFGRKKDSKEKTELIILITPRVIATLEDVDIVTEAFREKIGDLDGLSEH